MKSYNIYILKSFYSDLNEIFNNLHSFFGTKYAYKIIKTIVSSINSLKTFPNSNPIFSYIDGYIVRKKIVNKRYIIIYIVIQNSIYIYNVFDGRRNINSSDLFKK